MTPSRRIGRLAAAGTGLLAASALALAAAPTAGAQTPIPSTNAYVPSFAWERVPLPKITNPCLLPSRPCDLYWEEPELIPDPDPERFIVPVGQFELTPFRLPELQGPGLALGG